MWTYNYNDELYHYGIPGMKWGHRKKYPIEYGSKLNKLEKARKKYEEYNKKETPIKKRYDKIETPIEKRYNKVKVEKSEKYVNDFLKSHKEKTVGTVLSDSVTIARALVASSKVPIRD